MTIKELKGKNDYEFECNMSEEFRHCKSHDEWGCACVWFGENIGVEYNFCYDGGESYCAIYKTEINNESGYMETDYDTFIHYDIDFDNPEWKNKLENAMCEALIEFFKL